MKIGLLGGLLAALLGFGGGGWDADDGPPPTVCAPADEECGVSKPPPGASSVHRPKPAVCPDDGPCAPYLPHPARRS